MALIFADAAGQKIFRKTSPYGVRTLNGITKMHEGDDWGTGIGTGLFSIRPGGILNCWADSVGGNIVTITYNDIGLRFQFHHCKEFAFPTGYKPKASGLFGITGDSGNAKGKPHVHVETFINAHITDDGRIDKKGTRVDPKDYDENKDLVLPEISTPPIQGEDINKIKDQLAKKELELQVKLSENEGLTDQIVALTTEKNDLKSLINQITTDRAQVIAENEEFKKSLFGQLYMLFVKKDGQSD